MSNLNKHHFTKKLYFML